MKQNYCQTCVKYSECKEICPRINAELTRITHGQIQYNKGKQKKRKPRIIEIPFSRLPTGLRVRIEHEMYGTALDYDPKEHHLNNELEPE